MCGITGLFSLNETPKDGLIQEMTKQLSHRGPDAEGFFSTPRGRCQLGHRRLSIIDLSTDANQPMTSDCGNYTMVYNGEVYNYESIRKKLEENPAISFHTSSDSEVVLKAFIEWGPDFVSELNGMFSIAIYHHPSHQLYIFRDRLGIKPLYYFNDDGFFAFASEINALLPLTKNRGKFHLDYEAINHYLRLGYIPEPLSIYKEIRKFPSGNRAVVNESGIELKSYWKPESEIKGAVISDEKEAKSTLNKLINDSIKLRLKSDVPFGVFLSGGIDSSTVAAVAQKNSKQKINTFSIGFKEADFNESHYAKEIAKEIGTEHHEFIVSFDDAKALIPELQRMFGEPFADASAIPTYLVSKLASEKVKMVLTGDGGDEQFMGYGMYNWAERLNNPFLKLFSSPIRFMLKNSGNNRMKRASEMFNFDNETNLLTHVFSIDQFLFSKNELVKSLKPSVFQNIDLGNRLVNRKLSPSENQALFDLKYYLKDDLLTKVDRSSMKASIEARVPLLDHQMIAFSLNLDQKLKVKDKNAKYLLKEVLYDYVPKSLFDRPKWGFGLPLKHWLSNELKPILNEYINEEKLANYSIFDVESVLSIKNRYLKGEDYLFNKLWSIMMLIQWFDEYKEYYTEHDA